MVTIKIPTRPGHPPRALTVATPETRADRLAGAVLGRPLTAALAGVFLVQFAGWLPHYLTWPWWSDHDVFASLALGWHRGVLPYRDLTCNNFPGTIYIHWMSGRLFGWGWSPAINALDAGMLLGLGALFVNWSRRRLGSALPGVVGFVSFASYYFGLNYSLTGQRDWQGPCLAMASLLVLDGWPSRAARWASAWGFAFAFAVRPQVALLGPAFLLAIDDARRRLAEERGVPSSRVQSLIRIADWSLALLAGLAVAFLPLALSGVFGDFLASLRHVAYSGRYNRVGPERVATRLAEELLPLSVLALPALAALLASHSRPATKRLVRTALVAYGLVTLYKPLSPIPAPYLDTPLRLCAALLLAVTVAMAVQAEALAPAFRLGLVLAVLPLGVTTQPRFCGAVQAIRGVRDMARGGEPAQPPPGYTHNYVRSPYPWNDYRRVLRYLRKHTGAQTRVANALKHEPAIAGASGRVPAFSAESLAWLRLVNPADESRFVRALEAAPDSVVVWSPREAANGERPSAPSVFQAIERLYEPDVRFGDIEVWRRKSGQPATALSLAAQVE